MLWINSWKFCIQYILYCQQLSRQHLIKSILGFCHCYQTRDDWTKSHLKLWPWCWTHLNLDLRLPSLLGLGLSDAQRFIAVKRVNFPMVVFCLILFNIIVMYSEESNFNLQRLTSTEVVLPSPHPLVRVVQTYQVTVPALGCCPRWYTGMDILDCCNSPQTAASKRHFNRSLQSVTTGRCFIMS